MPGPRVIQSVSEMRREARLARVHTRRVAFVPTMGYLHEGHLTLLRAAREAADVVVLSIFVNPIQFGPKEDLGRYPRDLDGDLAKAAECGCDLAFVPSAEEMYPDGFQTYVEVRELQNGMCGDRRPGHFVGVATVVLKLLHIVEPDVAFFGEKDFQQLAVIRRMVRDLDVPVEIVGRPIVREPDGLAMSSRNAYLSPDDRQRALVLSRALFSARDKYAAGERNPDAILAAARAILDAEPGARLDYLELRDAHSLQPSTSMLAAPSVLAVAAFLGNTRLIDNVVLA
jgi:pantoate--beta-alanine ligase